MTQHAEPFPAVYELYGFVMFNAQLWERALALIWWQETKRPNAKPSGDFDTRSSKKAVARLEAALLRTTAPAARAKVAATLGDEADAEIGELIEARNRLAHRFLIEQIQDGGTFRPGTLRTLVVLGERFFLSLGQLHAVIDSYPVYEGPVLDGWPELAERIHERLNRGERLPTDLRTL